MSQPDPTPAGSGVFQVRPYEPADEVATRRFMLDSLEFDRFPGVSAWEIDRQLLSMKGRPEGVAVGLQDGVVCGIVSPRHDDLTVHPRCRRRGLGRRLYEAGLEIAAGQGQDELRLWVPRLPGAEAFARAMGLSYSSSLWHFVLPASVPVPPPSFPAFVTGRTLGPWLPIERYVDLLNVSFRGHPGNVDWTVSQVEIKRRAPDFDPTAVMLLTPTEAPEEPVAFVRIMIEPEAENEPLAGEVAILGVLPEWRRRGLGRELLRWGVAEARGRGAKAVGLYVEAENERAAGLYRKTGFEPESEWPHWSRRIERH